MAENVSADPIKSPYYACLCAIVKDEDAALLEWVQYHMGIGFEHLFLYDNGSRTSVAGLLREYVEHKLVTVVDFPQRTHQQLCAYADSLRRFGPETVWMAYVDVDEFIVPKRVPCVREFLDGYRDYAALGVHWVMFGSNGHHQRPPEPVTMAYTTVIEKNNHIKVILQPAKTAGVGSPHNFCYLPGEYCVNEDGVPVLTHQSYHTSRHIQINHYYYKSREDFSEKMTRGLATPAKSGRTERSTHEYVAFERQFALSSESLADTSIQQFELPYRGVPDAYGCSVATLAAQAHAHCGKSLSLWAQEIVAVLAGQSCKPGKAARPHILARRLVQACLRYHQSPPAWLLAARIYMQLQDKNQSLHFLCKVLQELESPWRTEAYGYLADWYAAFGDPQSAAQIFQELQK